MSIESTPPGGGNIPEVKPQFPTQKATPVQPDGKPAEAKDAGKPASDAVKVLASQNKALDTSRQEIPTVAEDVLNKFVKTQRRGGNPDKLHENMVAPAYGMPYIKPTIRDTLHENMVAPAYGMPYIKPDHEDKLHENMVAPAYGMPYIEPEADKLKPEEDKLHENMVAPAYGMPYVTPHVEHKLHENIVAPAYGMPFVYPHEGKLREVPHNALKDVPPETIH